ncbi:energy transducer TonB [Klebsiella pneumoniae subsp. pneumoniae]|nr:energy transducer TonB [Klebsiella pneumoniae subsp. pneumoniae]
MAFAIEKKEEIVPVCIKCPAPVMPVMAQALKIEGSVDYAAWVNDKGDVYSIDITGDEVFFRETEVAIKKV